MTNKVLIAGVGMVKFTKPGKSEMYDVMGAKAATAALADAGVDYKAVQQAYAGFVTGDERLGYGEIRIGRRPVDSAARRLHRGSDAARTEAPLPA